MQDTRTTTAERTASYPTDSPTVVTVGLLYANGPLHLGHLRGYMTGDLLARALRKVGQQTVFVSGSDIHGTPVAVNAKQEQRDPESYAIEWHETNRKQYPKFDIDFDYYGHTREQSNRDLVGEFIRSWEDAGHVLEKETEVAWDPVVDQPLPDRYVEGTCPHCGAQARGDECDEGCQRHLEPGELVDPTSVITGNTAEYRPRSHKFLRLSDFQSQLQTFIDQLDGTQNAQNQPREWIENELKDLCLTRDLNWGIPYPDDPEERVLYVWVDAPIGYISATKSAADDTETFDWKDVWHDGNGEVVHVIGKDIIQQHAVFWPAMLDGAGYATPGSIVAHGFVTIAGKSLSTSRGRAVWASEFLEEGFDPSTVRYYLTTTGSLQSDIDFEWVTFAERVTADLVDCLGNFVYRSLLFAYRTWGGTPLKTPSDEVLREIEAAVEQFRRSVTNYSVREIGTAPVELARLGNEYLQRHEPWNLVDEQRPQAAQVISDCVRLVKAIAILIEPVAPGKAEVLWSQLCESGSVHETTIEACTTSPPEKFSRPDELFEPIDDEQIARLQSTLQSKVER